MTNAYYDIVNYEDDDLGNYLKKNVWKNKNPESMPLEIWKPVLGFEGLYEVSNIGRVRSVDRITYHSTAGNQSHKGLILSQQLHRYLAVKFCLNGVMTNARVAILVAKAFVPNPENKPQVNHINCIKTCNFDWNLEWNTQSENIQHRNAHGLSNLPKSKDHYLSKKIEMYKSDILVEKFDCIMDAERKYKIWNSAIVKCLKGNLKSTGGYTFKYAN